MCAWLILGPLPALDSVSQSEGKGTVQQEGLCWPRKENWRPLPLNRPAVGCWAAGGRDSGAAAPGVGSISFPDQGFHLLFWGQEDAALYRHLGALLRHCLMISADGEDRTEEFHRSVP